MAIGPGGFYFRRGGTVHRVDSAGRLVVAARGLLPENFGIAVAPDRSVLAVEYARRRVVRVQPNGRRSIVAAAQAPWAPTGVSFAGNALYVLEAATGAPIRMRVRRITGGRSRVLAVVP